MGFQPIFGPKTWSWTSLTVKLFENIRTHDVSSDVGNSQKTVGESVLRELETNGIHFF